MIYLDYAATTPLDPAVLKKMLPYFSREFANPASVHTPGQKALKALDDARYGIADLLKISGHDITFTSGATEANNLVLRGITEANGTLKGQHIITTKIEHDSILEPAQYLESKGVAFTYLNVDGRGAVTPEAVINALRPNTTLVSIGYVNSETGSIQPIKQIGRRLRAYNERRLKDWLNTQARKRGEKPKPVLFHTDATQALNFFNCSPSALQVDLMSLSAHKIYGPKGIGLLYAAPNLQITPLLFGGHQERNRRSGTVNVPGAIGFFEALKLAIQNQATLNKKIGALRDRLSKALMKKLPQTIINTPLNSSSPAHLNISFPGLEGDLIQVALDEKGIAVSTGSACASGDIDASTVLSAMGRDESSARGAIRLTLGKYTNQKEIDSTVKTLTQVIERF